MVNGGGRSTGRTTIAMDKDKDQSSRLSIEQLTDLRDRLKQPLHDQSVMIPLGSQAFVPGTLSSADDTVTLIVKGRRTKVSRSEALEILQAEIQAQKPKPKQAPPKPKSPTEKGASPNPASTTTVPQFYEIREQIDDDGNEIKGEAISVTKQLKLVQQQDDDNGMTHETIATKPLKPLSDQEYSALATRLEELAKLEEQDAANKQINQVSSKKLQSKGWSKGFLNTPKKEPKPKRLDRSSATGSNPERSNPDTKKVQFGADTVQEIPNTGQSSSLPVRPPSRPIEPTLFSGVVAEKQTHRAKKNVPTTTTSKPKKLSRFAMERQQGLR